MAQYGVTRLEENTLVGQGEQACLRRCEWIVSLPTVPDLMDGFSRSEPIIYIRIMITFTRFLHSQTLIQSYVGAMLIFMFADFYIRSDRISVFFT